MLLGCQRVGDDQIEGVPEGANFDPGSADKRFGGDRVEGKVHLSIGVVERFGKVGVEGDAKDHRRVRGRGHTEACHDQLLATGRFGFQTGNGWLWGGAWHQRKADGLL